MRKALLLFALFSVACSSARQRPSPPEPAGDEGAAGTVSDPTAPTLSAGARIESVEPEPAAIEITRGDTLTFGATFRDARGERVTAARWGITTPDMLDGESFARGDSKAYALWGEVPGEGAMGIWVQVPSDSGFQWKQLASVPVRVREWPAARIEIAEPTYKLYAGSTFRLTGRVLTTHDTEHATARLSWSSTDPEIVEVTAGGVASFRKPGRAQVRATAEGVTATRAFEVLPNPVSRLDVEAAASFARTGDVVRVAATARDTRDRAVEDVHVSYSVSALEGSAGGATVYPDGAFVAQEPGTYLVMATAGGRTGSVVIRTSAREVEQRIVLEGRGKLSHVSTSDIWVFEGRDGRDYAYTGTWAEGGGQRMFVWDVTDPTGPVLTDSVVVDARVVNDVKVNEDATLAVITREGASDRKNGIVILDIADPAHPRIVSVFTDGLTGGVHNTWIHGELVYAIHNGTAAMHIVDISDPANPKAAGRWELRPGDDDKYLHDVWVKDGLAYLSYWDDGLVILDVGAGLKGGTPRYPKFVSQYSYPTGNTHVAYRYGDHVFVGDEILACGDCFGGPLGPRGYIHVLDVGDIENPVEVARYEVPEAGAHNVWVEDDRLYVAYYQGGLRVVDVSGELRGDLYAQGRQIGWYHTAAREGEGLHANAPLAWGPQLFKGHVFVSDLNSGLWVVKVEPAEPLVP